MRAWYAKNSEKVNAKRSLKRADISGSTSLPVPPPNTSVSSSSSIYSVLPPSAYESLPVSPPSAYQPLPVPQPNYYPPPPIPTDEEIAEDTLNAIQEDQKAASILDDMLNGPKAKTNDEHYDIDAVKLLTKIRNKKGGNKRMSNKNKSKKNRKSKKNKK